MIDDLSYIFNGAAPEIIKRKKADKFNYQFVCVQVAAGESFVVEGSNDYFFLTQVPENVIVTSSSGVYKTVDSTNVQQCEHTGSLTIVNNGESVATVRAVRLIIESVKSL
ncbi:hypothetical protein SAMN05421780_11045 [Flexibacter flexilis DSM 6793]|uniref:Uncharacterized protein n=1 Tax=Flexibacter flexilis DSM 6793 TaxID=927664 RepID=A0A1I1M6I0_9BACT|nr:hypothetical protein [Flexibacter flexilis]SFC80825.1 hypothetical protein SAMN05421780_11045 [Flexibacter flexilis DSM 6793]